MALTNHQQEVVRTTERLLTVKGHVWTGLEAHSAASKHPFTAAKSNNLRHALSRLSPCSP